MAMSMNKKGLQPHHWTRNSISYFGPKQFREVGRKRVSRRDLGTRADTAW